MSNILCRLKIQRSRVFDISLCFVFIAIILLGSFGQLYNMIYCWHHQIPYEFRSYAGIGLSELILGKINPYDASQLSNASVPIVYVYPPMQSIIAAAITKIFGISAVSSHYLIAVCVMIFTPVVFALICWKYSHIKWPIIAGCALIITISCMSRFYLGALALLFFVILFHVIVKNPQNPSSIGLALLTYALFFTKQTYVVMGAALTLYLFIVNKKCALNYLLYLLGIGIVFLLISHYFFPGYLAETIFITQCSTNLSINHLLSQVKELLRHYGCLLACVCFLSAYYLVRNKKNRDDKWFIILYCIISVLLNAACAAYLSQNTGASYTYFQELVVVPLAYLVAVLPGAIMIDKTYISRTAKIGAVTVLSSVILLSCYNISAWSSSTPNLEEYVDNYQQAYQTISEYNMDGPVLISPSMAEYASLYSDEDVYYDWGQAIYCKSSGIIDKTGIISKLFKEDALALTHVVDDYWDKMDQMIVNKEFSLITTSSLESVIDESHLRENYVVLKEIPLCNCVGQETVEKLWVKRSGLINSSIAADAIYFDQERCNSSNYIITGFSSVEEPGTWLTGQTAKLQFIKQNEQAKATIHVSIHLYSQITEAQQVIIDVNGCTVFDDTVTPENKVIAFDMIPSDDDVYTMTFLLPDAVSPKELGMSDDERQLSLMLESIQIQ